MDSNVVAPLPRAAVMVYEHVVANPDWTVRSARAATGLGVDEIHDAISALRERRLMRPSMDPDRDWDPVGPEGAVLALLAEEEDCLRREQSTLIKAREDLLSLQPTYVDAVQRRADHALIDVVTGDGAAFRRLLADQVQAATGGVRIGIANPGRDLDLVQWLHHPSASGDRDVTISVRVLLDHTTAKQRLSQHRLMPLDGHKTTVRTLRAVPLRLILFGGQIAVLPVLPDDPHADLAVVHHPAVVGSFAAAFEQLWSAASPIVDGLEPDDGSVRECLRREILQDLAAGYRDEVIAQRVGLSVRTCRRHIAEIMDQLGATSRFQAGVNAYHLMGPDGHGGREAS